MAVIIGSARIDERGKATGGAAGDQKQTSKPDYKGEVSRQEFYVHPLGWDVIRPIDDDDANKNAAAMERACDNPNVGYDQNQRYGVVTNGTNSKTKTEGDCSSLVRRCAIEATGKDPGDFTTANAKSKLVATGKFKYVGKYKSGTTLYTGDVLCTKGHIVVVTSGAARGSATAVSSSGGTKSVNAIAKEVIAGKWGSGDERRRKLAAAGYNYAEVQAEVNAILNGGKTVAQITAVAKEVIAGKWGTGTARKQKLKAAGYDPDAVQKEVNRLLKK